MKLRGNMVIFAFNQNRLSAVWGSIGKQKVQVEGWVSLRMPDDVDAGSSDAVGDWIGRTLREAGCKAKACVIAIPRASVVLKRLTLPMLAGASHGDLASIVQLQMARQLTMPLQGAAIDHVLIGTSQVQSAHAQSEGKAQEDARDGHDADDAKRETPTPVTEVLAAALPGEHVAWCQSIAKAAGLKLKSVALRSEGSAALFSQLSYTEDGPVLGISVASEGVELGVIADGRVVFSRAVDIALPADAEDWSGLTSRMAIEAKRTRVGYRNSGDHRDMVCVGVLGDDTLATTVGKAVGQALELPWQSVQFPAAVVVPSSMDSQAKSTVGPLIGLMLGAAIDRPTYDFAHPRKAPDPAAGLRQAVLAAMLGIIIFGGIGYLVADQRLRALDDKIESAKADLSSYQVRYVKQLRTDARLAHLDNLSKIGIDWVGHLEYLSKVMPPSDQARLDSLDANLSSSVELHSKSNPSARRITSLYDAAWKVSQLASFNLSGRVESRSIANEFRGKLVQNEQYVANTLSADEPNRFDYVIKTSVVRPSEPVDEQADDNQASSSLTPSRTEEPDKAEVPAKGKKRSGKKGTSDAGKRGKGAGR